MLVMVYLVISWNDVAEVSLLQYVLMYILKYAPSRNFENNDAIWWVPVYILK